MSHAAAAGRRELSRQTATLNAIVDAIPAMVYVCDTDYRYRVVNRAYERWRGRHREEKQQLLLSEQAPLAGLLNKLGFESYLGKQMARGAGRNLAVLYIDLDRFKPINDTYGHATGDEVLRHFAMRLHCGRVGSPGLSCVPVFDSHDRPLRM